ncbi:MAG TPA: hypothetical protein VFY06_15855 [Verrucomicrobiae bacterium]|nr:hypothetical protein [Verrucomicrobiae bacterium]
MKLPRPNPSARSSGMFLIECLVYISVFAIVLGGATTAFYFCWDHSNALIGATDKIASALHTGERWRADIRAATGQITVQTNATGEIVRIPEGAQRVSYHFQSGEVSRQSSATAEPLRLLANVKSSQMIMDERGGVRAWRWELELTSQRKETHLPLRFTFEAAQTKP